METMDVDLKMRYNIYIYMLYTIYSTVYAYHINIFTRGIWYNDTQWGHVKWDITIQLTIPMYGYVPQIAIVVW